MIKQFVELVKMIFVSMLCPQLRLHIQALKECATFNNWTMWQQRSKEKLHSAAPAGTVAFTEDRLVYSKVLWTSAGQAERSHTSHRRGPEVLGLFLQKLNPAAYEKFWAIDFYLGCLKRQLGCNEQPQFPLVLTTALSALPNENCPQSTCSWVKNQTADFCLNPQTASLTASLKECVTS